MASATVTTERRRFFGGREGAQKRFVTSVTLPALAFMAVFMVLPIVWAFALSFFDFSPRRVGTPFLGSFDRLFLPPAGDFLMVSVDEDFGHFHIPVNPRAGELRIFEQAGFRK